ncbi:hypothetical protein PDJ90_15000, partial [Bacillus cereus]|nr:hypothetical protein [Bacillus cereus]
VNALTVAYEEYLQTAKKIGEAIVEGKKVIVGSQSLCPSSKMCSISIFEAFTFLQLMGIWCYFIAIKLIELSFLK